MADPDTVDRAVEAAQRLVCDVRDLSPEAVHRYLAYLDKQGLLKAVVVVLAAMVPERIPAVTLLAWTERLLPPEDRPQRR